MRWGRARTQPPSLVLLTLVAMLLPAACAFAQLEVRATKTFDMQSYSVRGDFSQFLRDNPLFLQGNRLDQTLTVEAVGPLSPKVHLDLFLDDSGFDSDQRRLRVDVAGRIWQGALGLIPVALADSRFLIGQKTGMGAFVAGDDGRRALEAFVVRPEGRSHRNEFTGRGAVQEYVLSDSTGAPNPLVVVGSERVVLDGRRLEAGTDYQIDYLEGSVLLSRDLLPLDERRRLVVEFEEGGSGSGFQSTVFGGRVTRRFGHAPETRARNEVTLGFAAEVDDMSAPASADTTGLAPGRLHVVEASARGDLSRNLSLRGRAALSRRDTDMTDPDEGGEDARGAYDVGATYRRHNLEVDVSRSLVEPGFRGVGLDRFQTPGEGRLAARDASVDAVEALYRAGKAMTLRARFHDAVSNLDDVRDQAAEAVQAAQVDVELHRAAGGTVGLHWLGESSSARAAGAADFVDGGRDRYTATHGRRLGRAASLALRGEVETAYGSGLTATRGRAGVSPDEQETARTVGAEVSSNPKKKVQWSLGGSVREVSHDSSGTVRRLVRDARAALSSDLGRSLDASVDVRHRKESPVVPLPEDGPGEETNTGEARVSWRAGPKLEGESRLGAEVRSRVVLDPNAPDRRYQTTQQQRQLPQTVVQDDPVLARDISHQLTWRPAETLEVSGGVGLRREDDLREGAAFSRDQSADARVSWAPSRAWSLSASGLSGKSFNRPSNTERSSLNQRYEAVRNFAQGSRLELSHEVDEVDDLAEPERSTRSYKDRLGVARPLSRRFEVAGGLSSTRERLLVHTDRKAVDVGLTWNLPEAGQRVQAGVEVGDAVGVDQQGQDLRSHRRRWFVQAGGRLGESGTLDMELALSSVGPDGLGGEGYRAVTSNVSLGVEF